MGGDALAALEGFDGARRQSHLELLADQDIGHRVIVMVDLDVVIDVHARTLPLGEDLALGRQRS